jgi:hypothetical protein
VISNFIKSNRREIGFRGLFYVREVRTDNNDDSVQKNVGSAGLVLSSVSANV